MRNSLAALLAAIVLALASGAAALTRGGDRPTRPTAVIPAKAGIHFSAPRWRLGGSRLFAGMTTGTKF